MIKRKDNFTDAIEALDKEDGLSVGQDAGEYQVLDNEGEIVTLAQGGEKNKAPHNKRDSVEPAESFQELRKRLRQAVTDGIRHALNRNTRK